MKITIIGAGYVGLVTGACFAELGNDVICVDLDEKKIKKLNKMESPIYEPGLEDLIKTNYTEKRLRFTSNIKDAIKSSDIVFIAVGTPEDEDGGADLSYVFKVANDIGKYMSHHIYVVNKSTVPVGTADKVRSVIENQLKVRLNNDDIDEMYSFDVISNPEFLKEGSAVNDCMKPDRIVIGADNESSFEMLKEVYRSFSWSSDRFICMDVKSAEMTKYAANAMLAAKISFMNEMSNICEKVDADINKVRLGIGSDSRIGYHFIYPGCGYGGSCFPKDVQALIKTGLDNNYEPKILKAVAVVNEEQKYKISQNIERRFGESLNGLTFGIWGLAFKPNTDDMREAPAITVINEIVKKGAKVKAYDPKAMMEAENIYLKGVKSVTYVESKYEAIKNVDALILITEWKEFRSPDFDKIKKLMKYPIIFDGRNQYNSLLLDEMGFEYIQIGVK